METTIFELVYSSVATHPFSPVELRALLERARASNSAAGITGILLYRNASFIQILEGEEQTVQTTFARIHRDRRHQRVRIIQSGPRATRSFSAWTMGFVSLDPKVGKPIVGAHAFSNNGTLADDSHIAALLDRFRNGEWSGLVD